MNFMYRHLTRIRLRLAIGRHLLEELLVSSICIADPTCALDIRPICTCAATAFVVNKIMHVAPTKHHVPCSPFCHKAKRALGSVLDSSKITVVEVRTQFDDICT